MRRSGDLVHAWVLLTLALMSAAVASPAMAGGRFALADPIWEVDDTAEIPLPDVRGWNRYQGFIDGYWLWPADDLLSLKGRIRAEDVNKLDDVPASSWFTPRNGGEFIPPVQIARANVVQPQLDRSGPLQVVAARVAGPEPYLQVMEPSGAACLLEFDDPGYPEMRSAAAVIASRLLYGAGYHVLPCFIDQLAPSDLELGPAARKIGEFGASGDLSGGDLEALWRRLKANDGRLRVAVSRLPDGTPIGPAVERGTRLDDPNDRIAHENRRSLRGLRVIAAWLSHTRMRDERTLDIYLEPEHHVRHYLIGLGAALGSWGTKPQAFGTESHESYWEIGSWLKNFASLGFRGTAAEAEPISPFRGVGALDIRGFDPLGWQPAYGFEPFRRTDWADALWGARLVSRFSDGQIRAAVDAGELSDPDARAYVAGALTQRRDRIARDWFAALNASDGYHILNPAMGHWTLAFEDLGMACGVKQPEDVQYVMAFRLPDTGETLGYQSRGGHALAFNLTPFLPPDWLHRHDPRRYACAAIRSFDPDGHELRGEAVVHIYFDPAGGPRVVGVER